MDSVISLIAPTVEEYIVKPIGRQLSYLCCYHGNINKVQDELKNLETIRQKVQTLVDTAKSNADEINVDVSAWLEKVAAELADMPQQNEGGSNSSCLKCCLNLAQRHQLSRKSTKRVKDIQELIQKGEKFDKVGHPVPLGDTKSPTLPTDYQILESRTLLAEKIREALADPNVNKVGVCGMGGVGKTKLLDEVKKLVLENKLFDRVIVVTVRHYKATDIQDQIGGMLNMELNMKAETKEGRAPHLRTKLVEMKDNILIMLDDLWKEHDLEKDFGIPCRSELRREGCKILMTSRSQDVLTNKMNIEKLFEVDFLNEEESWKFFVGIVGELDKNHIELLAKNVVKKCGGLPLALKIIAKVLKGKNVHHWKDALKQLEKHVSVNIEGVSDGVYSSLKLSYDWIKDEAKSLFLLCSVFPDDHMIFVENLQMYAMGMGLLRDINSWEDARNRVITLVDYLKSSSLLLESNLGDNYIQMHDVVRDVAKDIALKEDKMTSPSSGYRQSEWLESDRSKSYNAIFVNCTNFRNLPSGLKFPKLQLLILRELAESNDKIIKVSDEFFEGMEELRVLDMKIQCSRPSLTHSLKNLQTLCMSYCALVHDIDTIGQLKKLVILRINKCLIQELPMTMSQLRQLKVLDVSNCSKLKVIRPNIISSMTKLEELSLWSSFRRWGEKVSHKNKLIENVKLFELDHLTRLFSLRLEISKVDILSDFSDDLSLERLRKLEEFCICVGDRKRFVKSEGYATTLFVNIKSRICSIGRALEILLEGCERLIVNDRVGFTEDLFKPNGNHGYPRLKCLRINESSDMPRRIDVQVLFPELKNLTIQGGNNLEMLWYNNGLISHSFCKLQNILINHCDKLKYVFPSHIVTSLVSLNTLEISNCLLLEMIFEIEKPTDGVKVVPLTKLNLSHLPNLKCVWNNDPGEFLTFPNLKGVQISDCPQLKSIFPASFVKHIKEIETLMVDGASEIFLEDEASKLVSHEIVSFPSLRNLDISCKLLGKERSFWLRSDSFPKLKRFSLIGFKDDDMVTLPLEMSKLIFITKEFEMRNAFQLVQVFHGEENNPNQSQAKLESLYLSDLPNLTHVWKDNTQMTTSFDCLGYIMVRNCEKLKCLLSSSITFFNLKSLYVMCCNGMLNLFSSSEAKNLVNLKRVEIIGCEGMSSIVAAEGEGEEENGEIIFNKLTVLKLFDLPRLARFYFGKCQLKFPCLEELTIEICPDMKPFSNRLQNGDMWEYTRTRESKVLASQSHLCGDENMSSINNFFTEEIVFPSLRSLEMDCKALKSFPLKSGLFLKLNSFILIGSKDDDTVTLPLEMSHVLCHIENFTVNDVFQLVHIFPNEEENNHIQGRRANLKKLELSDLPNLTHVWKDSTNMTTCFNNLEDIHVWTCENLKCLLPSSITFFNLKTLSIGSCNRMTNLFGSSVAENLVNLLDIGICDCEGMTSIVAAEGKRKGDEEKGEEIIFKKLIHLRLENLPRLANIYSGKCPLKFPCLETLRIYDCPKMKAFSYGIISMPELKFMHIEGCPEMEKFSYGIISMPQLTHITIEDEDPEFPTKDINTIIEDLYEDRILRSIKSLFRQEGEEDSEEDIEKDYEDYSEEDYEEYIEEDYEEYIEEDYEEYIEEDYED